MAGRRPGDKPLSEPMMILEWCSMLQQPHKLLTPSNKEIEVICQCDYIQEDESTHTKKRVHMTQW